MSYFPDLFHSNSDSSRFPKILHVGWLDSNHEYPTGAVSDDFLSRLWEFCRYSIVECRGFHLCEFCEPVERKNVKFPLWESRYGPLERTRNGYTIKLGFGEIIVLGKNDVVYYSPNLIYHYILDHHYLPPQEFTEAILTSPLPTSDEYLTIATHESWHIKDLGEKP